MTATKPRPGYAVSIATALQAAGSIQKRTGTWFAAGLAEKGPLKAVGVSSLQQFVEVFGPRQSYSTMYDAADEYFSDGGALMYFGRVVGPAAASASHVLKDEAAATSLTVTARGPGAWGNALKIKVVKITSELFKIEVKNGSTVVEVSPELSSTNAAVSWAALSAYIELTLGASANNPKEEEVTLENGKDDRASITDNSWLKGLELFGKNLGPGQVSQVGRTSEAAHKATLEHAIINNRVAILDAVQTSSYSTISTALISDRNLLFATTGESLSIYGFEVGPWVALPPLIPGAGLRYTPPSSFVAAKMAAADSAGISPNKPAANLLGISKRAVGLEQEPYNNGEGTEVTRDALYSKGLNLITEENGKVMLYGYRSLADPNGVLQDWLDFGNCRMRMAIVDRAQTIAKQFVLSEIDGSGKTQSEFEGLLKAMLSEYWRKGSLYGATAEEAYSVNVGPEINTPEVIANRELKAVIGLRMSQDAEFVYIQITKVPVNQEIP